MSSTDEKKNDATSVVKKILLAFGVIIAIIVIICFIIAYLIIKTIARPICGWGFFQALLVIIPLIAEIAGYVIAFTGVGLPVTGVILIIGAIVETVSAVCDFVSGRFILGILGILGTIPIVGVLPQGLRAGIKLFQSIFKRVRRPI